MYLVIYSFGKLAFVFVLETRGMGGWVSLSIAIGLL